MNELKIYEAINLIDDDLILEAEQEEWTPGAYFVSPTPKWHIAVGVAAAAAAIVVGVIGLSNLKISGGLPVDPSVEDISSQGALSGGVVLSSPLLDDSDITSEPQKPDGYPTFLTAPDGTQIYTSEISEVYSGHEELGNKKTITLAEADRIAQTGEGNFTVKCDGFVYGYIPERALNRIDNPEMFKEREHGGSFEFLGEEFDVNTFEGKYSTEYMRIEAGDKFGSLTVKNAYTLFTDLYYTEGFSDVPGAFISDKCVEFDGELELTGYVEVTPMKTNYGTGGDMRFFPDGDSSVILPGFAYVLNKKSRKICHFAGSTNAGYYGNYSFDIGNMYKVECDTSGLQPGDSFVKVKIVLDNVRYAPGYQMGGWKVDLKSIELL